MKTVNEMTFKQFRKKFDLRFITEEKIAKLFNDGCKVQFQFRYPGKQGKRLLKEFCGKFTDIHSNTEKIYVTHDAWGWGSQGRDITISHSPNDDSVYYASEYAGCGNGDYYIIANEKLVLFLERD